MAKTEGAEAVQMRSFSIDIKAQVEDSLLTSSDMIDYFQNKMKVRNSNKIAQSEIEFKDNRTSVEIVSKSENMIKRNMKQYIKRFLRNKQLKDFIKVRGDGTSGFSLEYINKVDEGDE